MSRTYVIAEMGSTHDGNFNQALQLIKVAAQSGADAVKAQFWSSAERLTERRHAPDALETYRKYQLPRAWLDVLARWASDTGLEFLCTVYLPEDIPVVTPYVARFKIASFEALDEPFVRAHMADGRPVILSTGMMTHEEVVASRKTWVPFRQVSFLYCVSGYPTPLRDLNLACVADYDGLSDHSGHHETGGWAVMLGARIVEVHYRGWATDSENPDFPHSLTPDQLSQYVRNIREAERARGTPDKRVQPSELDQLRHRVVS